MKIIISHTFYRTYSNLTTYFRFNLLSPRSLSPFFFFLLSRSLARTRNPKNPDHKYFAVPPIGEVDALGECVSELVCGDKMGEEMDFFDRYRRQKTNGEKKRNGRKERKEQEKVKKKKREAMEY